MVSANFETIVSDLTMVDSHSPFCNWGFEASPCLSRSVHDELRYVRGFEAIDMGLFCHRRVFHWHFGSNSRARSGADKTRVDGYGRICTGDPGLDDNQRNA